MRPATCRADAEPSGVWVGISNAGAGAIAVGVVRSISGNVGEMFYPAQYSDPPQPGTVFGRGDIWGIYCAIPCENGPITTPNSSIWNAQFTYIAGNWPGMSPWLQLPGSAVTITMFTTPGGTSPSASDVVQTPWVLNTSGEVYRWSPSSGSNAQYGQSGQWRKVQTPEPATWISDGSMLGQSGYLYKCVSDACYNGNPAIWLGVAPYANGVPIHLKQIATSGSISQAVVGGNPALIIYSPVAWGIDYQGNIYFTEFVWIGGGAQ